MNQCFFRYLRINNNVDMSKLEELFNEKEIRPYKENDPLKHWVTFKQIIEHNEIFLPRVDTLNDPFECIINIDHSKGLEVDTIKKLYDEIPDKPSYMTLDVYKKEIQSYIKGRALAFPL